MYMSFLVLFRRKYCLPIFKMSTLFFGRLVGFEYEGSDFYSEGDGPEFRLGHSLSRIRLFLSSFPSRYVLG
jgi:hypothetical protein